jgi:hypothetical protein
MEFTKYFRRFQQADSGAMSPLIIVLFSGILITTGIGIDLLRYESQRSELQAALDRGVLAAASLSQSADPQSLVEDYVRLGTSFGQTIDVQVSKSGTINLKQISADATFNMPTVFMNMVGYSEINVGAHAAASQAVTSLEISLVLDISGTMRFSNRLPNLVIAASNFINKVTDNGSSKGTTINLVPYAGQVNPGPYLFSKLGGIRTHDKSSCLEFTSSDFNGTSLPSAGTYAQVPNFHHWAIDNNWMNWGWCPSDSTAVTYVSNDAAGLVQKIEALRLHDGTGTYNAMKWGLALLDPSTNARIKELVDLNLVDEVYGDRPALWDDTNTEKFIVLMTDGDITEQYRPNNTTDPKLDTKEVLPNNIPWSKKVSISDSVGYFYSLCTAAKLKGVTVFTIAFEASSNARTEMKTCATSEDDHFFNVNGAGISTAFDEIATKILKLRLIQ